MNRKIYNYLNKIAIVIFIYLCSFTVKAHGIEDPVDKIHKAVADFKLYIINMIITLLQFISWLSFAYAIIWFLLCTIDTFTTANLGFKLYSNSTSGNYAKGAAVLFIMLQIIIACIR